jgi:cofilin
VHCRCPDIAKVKPKMIFASSKDNLKKRLVGIACEVQGSDRGDIEYDEVDSPISSPQWYMA